MKWPTSLVSNYPALPGNYATNVSLTATQSLLRGYGLDVNLASLRQARLDTRSSEYELRGFAESLVAQTEEAYWDCALAQQQIQITEKSLALANDQLRETLDRIQLGNVAATEKVAAEAEVALRQEDLINARSAFDAARLLLLRLLSPSGNTFERDLELLDQPSAKEEPVDNLADHIQAALRMRPDLNQARLLVERDELQIVKTKNGLLPQLNLFVTLGRTGYASSFRGFRQQPERERLRRDRRRELRVSAGEPRREGRRRRAPGSRAARPSRPSAISRSSSSWTCAPRTSRSSAPARRWPPPWPAARCRRKRCASSRRNSASASPRACWSPRRSATCSPARSHTSRPSPDTARRWWSSTGSKARCSCGAASPRRETSRPGDGRRLARRIPRRAGRLSKAEGADGFPNLIEIRREAVLRVYLCPALMDWLLSLVLFAVSYGAGERGMTLGQVAWLGGIFQVTYMPTSLVSGRFLSRRNALPILIASAVGGVLSGTLGLAAHQFGPIFAAMALLGAFAASFFNSFQSFMRGETAPGGLTRTMALYTFAWSGGFSLGLLTSGSLYRLGPVALGGLTVLVGGVILLTLLIHRQRPHDEPSSDEHTEQGPPGSPPVAPQYVWTGWIIIFTAMFVQRPILTFYPAICAKQGIAPVLAGLPLFLHVLFQALGGLGMGRLRHWLYRRGPLVAVQVLAALLLLLLWRFPAYTVTAVGHLGPRTLGRLLVLLRGLLLEQRGASGAERRHQRIPRRPRLVREPLCLRVVHPQHRLGGGDVRRLRSRAARLGRGAVGRAHVEKSRSGKPDRSILSQANPLRPALGCADAPLCTIRI